MLKTIAVLFAIAGMLSLNSCRKDMEDTAIGNDFATAEDLYSESQNISDEAAQKGTVSLKDDDAGGITSACALVTVDSISTPGTRKTTVDFGTACVGNDGKTRQGKIFITHTGKYKDAGTDITITFQDYGVNGNMVDNSSVKTIHNNGYNVANHLTWTITVNGSVVLNNNRGTVTWTSNRVREMVAGEVTPLMSDDIYLITGNASGTSPHGGQFTANITSALRKDFTCSASRRNFTEGVIQITPQGKPIRTLDFGNGACDNVAIVTVNGRTRTINL